jgi:hypothetical protein
MPDFVMNAPLAGQVQQSTLISHENFAINAPAFDIAPGTNTTTIISLRAPQYGIPLSARQAFLAQQLPNGTPSYVGLFTSMPTRAGVGGTEASGSGYARVAHSSWRSSVFGGFVARRHNNGEIRFGALTGDLTVVGWGAWDAAADGNLLAFGLLRDDDGNARVWELAELDTPGWPDGLLIVGIM